MIEENNYPVCPRCGCDMMPVWFIEEEYDSKYHYKTGRKRRACSHFECPECFQKECVDDSFDGEWY